MLCQKLNLGLPPARQVHNPLHYLSSSPKIKINSLFYYSEKGYSLEVIPCVPTIMCAFCLNQPFFLHPVFYSLTPLLLKLATKASLHAQHHDKQT